MKINNSGYNEYQLVVRRKINKKKVIVLIFLLITLIGLIIILKNSIEIINEYKVYEQYEEQLAILKKKEEEKQEEIKKEQERIRQERIPKLTQVGRDNMQTIYKSETKRVFLTFDDGPSTVTSSILDTLKQQNVKASFFVLGSRVEVMPEMTKKIYEEGHYIANHGYSHTYSSIYSSPQEVLNEYNKCNELVKNAIGVPEYNSYLFRFPGGLPGGPYATIKNEAKELLSKNDILSIDWNALSGDAETTKPTVEYELSRIIETVSNKNSVVILMHDAPAKKATAEALPQIINWLKENEYEFKNFYEIIK